MTNAILVESSRIDRNLMIKIMKLDGPKCCICNYEFKPHEMNIVICWHDDQDICNDCYHREISGDLNGSKKKRL